MILRLQLDLPEDKEYIRSARQLSRCMLENLNTSHTDIDDVEMVVDELCGNVIRHAHSISHRFMVVLEYHKDRVSIDVIDRGGGFTNEDIRPIGTSRPDINGGLRIGGFGMPLVRLLTDKFEFTTTDPHGTTAHAEKWVHYDTRQDEQNAEEMDREDNQGNTITITAGT